MVHIVSRPNTGASMFSSSLHKSFLEYAPDVDEGQIPDGEAGSDTDRSRAT